MRKKVGVGAQLVNVEAVLLAIGQTAPDKRLQDRRGRRFLSDSPYAFVNACSSRQHHAVGSGETFRSIFTDALSDSDRTAPTLR